jgi:hypothetical protein
MKPKALGQGETIGFGEARDIDGDRDKHRSLAR